MVNLVKANPSDKEIRVLAEEIYETELRNELMPPFDDAPSVFVRGCLNDAAIRLGWKPKENQKP